MSLLEASWNYWTVHTLRAANTLSLISLPYSCQWNTNALLLQSCMWCIQKQSFHSLAVDPGHKIPGKLCERETSLNVIEVKDRILIESAENENRNFIQKCLYNKPLIWQFDIAWAKYHFQSVLDRGPRPVCSLWIIDICQTFIPLTIFRAAWLTEGQVWLQPQIPRITAVLDGTTFKQFPYKNRNMHTVAIAGNKILLVVMKREALLGVHLRESVPYVYWGDWTN